MTLNLGWLVGAGWGGQSILEAVDLLGFSYTREPISKIYRE